MASFAKLDSDNKVIEVHSLHNNELMVDGVENEQKGIDFLNNLFKTNDNWKQTSYNTLGGVHRLGGTPFRKNYASIGDTYDKERDAFITLQPYPSWTLNEDTCRWNSPVPCPGDKKGYAWNESTTTWDLVPQLPNEDFVHADGRIRRWDETRKCWDLIDSDGKIRRWNKATKSWDLIDS